MGEVPLYVFGRSMPGDKRTTRRWYNVLTEIQDQIMVLPVLHVPICSMVECGLAHCSQIFSYKRVLQPFIFNICTESRPNCSAKFSCL